ncbi:MAG TPA: cupin domain-containing protein, partial [Candidatus Methanomethylicus sp.]|nr:cupin domain-containing protein [Candidatus Methanomethylicus sp.]
GAANMGGLVDYQKAAIVSRTLIDEEAGTITLFAFDEGQKLSEHTAPFDAMAYIIDGEAEISIEKKQSRLKTGDMIIMPANKPHALRAIKRYKMLLIMVRK